jgi:hypothetical protein
LHFDMRRTTTFLAAILALNLSGQFNPQAREMTEKFFSEKQIDIPTPAFQKEKGFTRYSEMMAFLEEQVQKHGDRISYRFIGQSQKGKPIPLVEINGGERGKDKPRVWLQGGLHGNEPASTEGVLYLIYQLLNDPGHKQYLDHFTFGIVPMANIDGYEKQDRYAANGLDLNRDQTKFTAPESQYLKKAFTDFRADIAMDFHEYRPFRRDYMRLGNWGVNCPFDVMFLYSGNLNVPRELREYTRNNFVAAAEARMDKEGYTHHNYFSSAKYYGEIQLNEGSVNSRSSATSYALTNCISTLVEVRGVGIGRTSFKRRTYITYSVAMAYLEYAFSHTDELMSQLELSRKGALSEVIVTSEREKRPVSMPMIDNYEYELEEIEFMVNDSWKSKATLTRKAPAAYLIMPGNEEVVERLELLGIAVRKLEQEKVLKVQAYQVVDYFRDVEVYEGVHRQEVKTVLLEKELTLPKGTCVVDLAQPGRGLAAEVLEPEAPNSFVSFSIVPTGLGEELPVYRYLSDEDL